MTTHPLLPWDDWSSSETIRIRTNEPTQIAPQVEAAESRLASGTGKQLHVQLEKPTPDGNALEAAIEAHVPFDGAGEYAGTVSLNPFDEKAAAAELTVKARHPFLWPFLILLVAMLVGVGGTALWERRRRRDVLRETLTRVGGWLQFTARPSGLYDLPTELVGPDPKADLFPRRGNCKNQTLEVPKLYCAIGEPRSDLDSRTKEVQDLLNRVDRWWRGGLAMTRLRAGLEKLPQDEAVLAEIRNDTNALLSQLGVKPGTDATAAKDSEGKIDRVTAQARVLEAFARAWPLWIAAGRPNGSLDLPSAYIPEEGRTSDASNALASKLFRLEFDLAQHGNLSPGVASLVASTPVPSPSAEVPGIAPEAQSEPPWLSEDGQGFAITERIRRKTRLGDLFMFSTHALFASVLFLLPLWLATNFGSLTDYVAVVVGGFLGKVALDETLTPVRDTNLAPSTDTAKAQVTEEPVQPAAH